MKEHFDISVAPIASLGAETTSFTEWLCGLHETAVFSYIHDTSKRIAVESADSAISALGREFPTVSHFFSAKGYISDAFRITAARRCLLVGGQVLVVYGDDQLYCAAESVSHELKGGCRRSTPLSTVVREEGQFNAKIDVDGDAERLRDEHDYLNIFLCPWNNYGHWHVHNLSFVEVLREIITSLLPIYRAKGIRVICSSLNDHFLPELKEFTLARLREICAVEIIGFGQLDKPLWLDNVIVCSTSIMIRGCRWPATFGASFRKLRVPRNIDAPRLIYCNRSHSGRRGISNEDEVEESLRSIGFSVLRPGEMSFEDQRKAFSNAQLIVSSHGAALTNMIYSHMQPSIIELTHDMYGRPHYEWFQYLASVMGLRYLPFMTRLTEENRQKEYNSRYFSVDVAELESALRLFNPAIGRDGA